MGGFLRRLFSRSAGDISKFMRSAMMSISDYLRRPFGYRAPIRLGLPWRMPCYSPLNGYHPLVASFVDGNPAVRPVVLHASKRPKNTAINAMLRQMSQQTRLVFPELADLLIDWLNFTDQMAIESQVDDVDVLFLHTTPLYLGTLPWIFHFESFPTLFKPFMSHGTTTGIDLKAEAFFQLVKNTLESPQCRRIFSHMRESLRILDHVFDSPIISSKLSHVPVGVTIPPAAKSLAKFDQGRDLRILFTNSLHQDPSSFYLRGGHHLLEAFVRLRRHLPEIELTVLSSVPDDLTQRFSTDDLKDVNWISRVVDDATLEELLLDHHLFALPAAGLHTYSFLRAISHGCVPIVSDAPGYDELTQGIKESVIVVRGIRDQVYRREPAGWISDCYAPFTARSEYFVQQIHDGVINRSQMSDLRRLAARNIEHCRLNFSLEASHAEFNRKMELEEISREELFREESLRERPIPPLEVRLVEENFRGYNIVCYLGRYWGVPMTLGHVNLTIHADRSKTGVISASSMSELKKLIIL